MTTVGDGSISQGNGKVSRPALADNALNTVRSGRGALLERLVSQQHDALIVGGGVNGAVSALALAAHGLRVALIESGDFASGVSQESSNLIWGGFKYLQTGEVRLVAGLCRSRNRLARAYPSRLLEARFLAVLGDRSPYSPGFATLGAHAYWALGRFSTRRPQHAAAHSLADIEPAVEMSGARGAVEYSDYLLADTDARFVVQFILDAADRGAVAVSRLSLCNAERAGAGWRAEVLDRLSGTRHCVSARVLVNAAGPDAAEVAGLGGGTLKRSLRFSKGVHIVVPRITASGRVLAFFDHDQRLFYVIPMGHRSLIGTTDTRVEGAQASVTAEDRSFLLDLANEQLRLAAPLRDGDVIAERCGVRALVVERAGDENRDWMDLSRRHAIETDPDRGMVSILGGKLSDCLNVGGKVLDAVRACGLQPARGRIRWFGEPPESERARFVLEARRVGFDALAAATLWRRHGRRALEIAELVGESPDLGLPLSDLVDYSAAEVEVMARHEQIVTMQDFLRRRTMLALLEPAQSLQADPGVARSAKILFGAAAGRHAIACEDSWAERITDHGAPPKTGGSRTHGADTHG